MQIEIYNLKVHENNISVVLEAVCDSFSSLLWDIEYYSCGAFEVYIAASPHNIEIFQTGRIVGRDDDKEHFGIIETVKISTDSENGDYLTVSGNKTVILTRNGIDINIINRLVPGSAWLSLREGKNVFTVRAVKGVKNLKITLMHRNAFVGV